MGPKLVYAVPVGGAEAIAAELDHLGLIADPALGTPALGALPAFASEAIRSYLAACSSVLDRMTALSRLVGAIGTDLDRRREASVTALIDAEAERDAAAEEMLIALGHLHFGRLRTAYRWLLAVEQIAIHTQNAAVIDIVFEEGLRPAMARMGRSLAD